jgi:EmrB/QacA subfamily drug resistance transporter
MAAIDATVVGIALPSIGRDLHAQLGALQWVVTGYTLTLSALLLPGGSLGDHYGRRKVFNLGVVWFTITSAACSIAPNSTVLIITRVLQGVGAALLTPGSLAIIEASFDADDRGRAIGAWSGLGGVATAGGPLLGGYLIAVASWRWIFLINVPVGALVLVLSSRHVPESKDPNATGRPDAVGAALAVLALVGLTYAFIEGPTLRWTNPTVLLLLSLGVAGAVAFVLYERSAANPMLPFAVFRERQFTVTNAVTFVIYAGLGGALFLLPVTLQVVDGYSPLASGVSLLPLTALMFLLSARSGRIASRIGPRLQMSVGPIVVGAGLALLERASTDRSYVTGVLPAIIVFGLGLSATVAPLTSTAMGALPPEHAGLASAVNNDVARLGSLIAVATLPALAGITGSSYLHAAQLASGFRTAVYIAGAACAVGGIASAFGIRNPPRLQADEAAKARPPVTAAAPPAPYLYCPVDATPLARRR